jgi:VWFA-related protein
VPVRRHRLIVWFLVASLALPVAPGFAQEEEGGGIRRIGGLTFVDEVQLTIANLIVYVTDKKGVAITDLAEDDFEVYQDGDRKQITNFKLYTDEVIRTEYEQSTDPGVPEARPGAEATVASGPQPVHLVLYIDNQNLDPLDRNRVLSQTREFVRNHLHPPARMMVVAYQRSFEVLQEFTSDPSEVLRALRVVRTYTGGRTSHDSSRRDIADRIKQIRSEARAGTATQRSRGGGQRANEWSEVYSLVENFARETVNDLHFTMDALRQTITSLSGLPGKKGIIYVSNGLPMIPGIELFYEVNKQTSDSSVLTNMFEFDRTRDYRQLAASANAQGVTFYTVDASGLSLDTMGSAEYMTDSDPMVISIGRNNYIDSQRLLADETGGMAIFNTNDIAPRLELVAQDMFTYYSIGYPLQASGQDKVHKVKVKLRDDPAFADYELRYRPRFVEKSLETKVQDRVVSSLVFEIDENPMDLDIETGTPATATANRWLLPARISFPLNTIALLPEGEDYVARVVVFIAARDNDGKKSDLVRQTHEIRVPAMEYDQARNTRFTIDAQLLMEAGRYKVSMALLDPLTRQVSYKTISASVHPKK